MLGLPFDQVWAVDFEFIAPPGELPEPVCMVARELGSGQLVRLWADQLGPNPPFEVSERTLFVAFFASAEWSCFLQLGWPLPARVLDLWAEFRVETNGLALPGGRSLLSALSHHRVGGITKDEKHDMRERIMAGGPWRPADRAAILDYCQSDVDCLAPLLERMLPAIRATPLGLGQALLRGRYTEAVAHMEHTGVPIDVATLEQLRAGWGGIKTALIADVNSDFGVYDGPTFKLGMFADYLARAGIAWPRTPAGRLELSEKMFSDMARSFPQLAPLKELRHALGEMRLEALAVGRDGRNRVLLSPFATMTGRNAPSNTRFIFGPAVWLRGLIKPQPGRALAYIDWSSQEVAIAACLSGDQALLEAVLSGDPYLAFAKRAGLAPAGATKATHAEVRERCKVAVLGTNYGMQSQSLALRTGLHEIEAAELLRRLAWTFPGYAAWSRANVDRAQLLGRLETVFGWQVHVTSASKPTSQLNWPMQSHGAEMLRLACCLATERDVDVCAPVHDALLIEAPTDEIDSGIAITREAMAMASRAVLDGFEIATDVTVVRSPQRYADPRGAVMWRRVNALLARIAA